MKRLTCTLLVCCATAASVHGAGGTTSAFTYQGQLQNTGQAVTDLCDFELRLFTAAVGGQQVGSVVFANAVPVTEGLFTIVADFGEQVFDGQELWLEITVDCPQVGGGPVVLAPRQLVTATPYAVRALLDETFAVPFEATVDFAGALLDLDNPDPAGTAIVGEAAAGDGLVGRTQSGTAVRAVATGPGDAVRAVAQGTGIALDATGLNRAAVFGSTSNTSILSVVTVNSIGPNSALDVNSGAGNGGTAIAAASQGRAGLFSGTLAGTTANVLEARTISQGAALRAQSNGLGKTAEFESLNANLVNPAVTVDNVGQGNALRVDNQGNATAVMAFARAAGEAGRFEIPGQANPSDALVGSTFGTGDGVNGFSRKRNGVFGRTDEATTFNSGLPTIVAGVRGETGIAAGPDNFAVAGVAAGYGTGVLGVGDGGGHGVVGVSGFDEAQRTIPGVWGFTREDSNGGSTWPPHFPIDGSLGPKGRVGVLGQGVFRVGVWGESLNRVGVVGVAGDAGTANTPPIGPVGIYGEVLGDEGSAGRFALKDLANFDPVLVAESSARGPAAYFNIDNSASNAPTMFASTAGQGPAGEFVINRTVSGAPVIDAYTEGVGSAGRFTIRNTSEFAEAVVDALQFGKGGAGRFVVDNAAATAAALVVQTQGIGPVAELRNFNDANANNIVDIASNGLGRALNVNVDNAANASNIVEISVNTAHHPLFVAQSGSGEVAHFQHNNATSPNNGVYVEHIGPGHALKAVNNNPAFTALAFAAIGKSAFNGQVDVIGNVIVDGSLCATSVCAAVKNFEIDHPLDPANRILRHASVESSELKNMYDGVVVLDAYGAADVVLPAWFTALNADFRYQLTPIGGAAPSLHIAREIAGGSFSVAGGLPGQRVSWQITGVRRDAYALANPLVIEAEKLVEQRGLYLHPEAYGLPVESRIHAAQAMEIAEQAAPADRR